MASINRSLKLNTKTKLSISPALIKKMEIFSLSYGSIQNTYTGVELSENLTYSATESLDSFLLEQISNLYVSLGDQKILARMVELLDDNGLFTSWTDTISTLQSEFNISRRKAYDLLATFQELEPEGVGATSTKNFIEIQITKHDFDDEEFKKNTLSILKFEKELIAGDLQTISNKTGISLNRISLCLLYIKNNIVYTLPRQQFSYLKSNTVVPSAKVELINNVFTIEILEDFSNVKNSDILKILQERATGLKSILTVFFQKQKTNIFENGELLNPVTQKTIAEITGLSQSTVSRLVNSKYIQVNNRVYLLKSLFQRKINKSNFSASFIKKYILSNINKTDIVITTELEKIGLNISRRTVNYYRNKFF